MEQPTTQTTPKSEIRDAYSVEEAARRLSISRGSLYALIGAGEIATIKLGKRRLVPQSAIDDLIAKKTVRQPTVI